jgi:predicted ATPase
MNLEFQKEYKSIKHLPISELPDFTVITGANGAGKTHLLRAIETGKIKIVGIETDSIKYYNWSALVTPDDQAVQPRALESGRNETCDLIAQFCDAHQELILRDILITYRAQYPVAAPISINKKQLCDYWDKSVVRSDFWNGNESDVITWYVNEGKKRFFVGLEHVKDQTKHAGIGFETVSGNRISVRLDYAQVLVLRQLLIKAEKSFFSLTKRYCLQNYPLVSYEQDPFIGSLTSLFAGYVLARINNATNRALAIDFDTSVDYLSKEEFIAIYGPAPWDIFNQVLDNAKLSFRFKEPSPDSSDMLQAQLYHIISGAEVRFSDLSSGERVLISLAHFLFFSQDSRQPTNMPSLILMDEVDAPLHPSMTVDLLRTVTDVIVKKYGRKVILATHSPSTVALSPEDSIHVMDVETKLIRKVTRDEGVQALTVGVPVLSIDIANRRQVFVESLHDVSLYERISKIARPHLISDVSISFMAAGHEKNGGCGLLISLVKQLNNAGNKAVFGIVDWDGERIEDGNLRVLGYNTRHSIENYLLDPILLGALLLREKSVVLNKSAKIDLPLLEDRENYFDLRNFDNLRLQRIADAIFVAMNFSQENLVVVHYVNGRSIQVPQDYLLLRGHNLEELVQKTFVELKRFHQEPMLKKEILEKILEDIPELLPSDFVALLTSIQNQRG